MVRANTLDAFFVDKIRFKTMGKPPKLFDFSLAFRVALTSMREMFAHDLKVKSRVVHLCRGAVQCANIAWQSQKLANHQARADVDLRLKRGTMSSDVPKSTVSIYRRFSA